MSGPWKRSIFILKRWHYYKLNHPQEWCNSRNKSRSTTDNSSIIPQRNLSITGVAVCFAKHYHALAEIMGANWMVNWSLYDRMIANRLIPSLMRVIRFFEHVQIRSYAYRRWYICIYCYYSGVTKLGASWKREKWHKRKVLVRRLVVQLCGISWKSYK